MIKLERQRQAIPGGLHGHHLRNKHLALLKLKRDKGTLESKDFRSNSWKPAKAQLKIESHNKCAYCEADTAIVAHGDVEHYRPKTIYWWLAYCYDNYLYSCQICNQVFKSNHFPCGGRKMRAPVVVRSTDPDSRLEELAKRLTHDPLNIDHEPTHARFLARSNREKPDLPDPYVVDPEKILRWVADEDLKTVRVEARPDIDRHTDITASLEDFYGLNREELLKTRWKEYRIARSFRMTIERSNDDILVADAKEGLQLMTAADFRFAGMIRYFVRDVWQLDVDG